MGGEFYILLLTAAPEHSVNSEHDRGAVTRVYPTRPLIAALLVASHRSPRRNRHGVVAGSVRSATGERIEQATIAVVGATVAALRTVSDDSAGFT